MGNLFRPTKAMRTKIILDLVFNTLSKINTLEELSLDGFDLDTMPYQIVKIKS